MTVKTKAAIKTEIAGSSAGPILGGAILDDIVDSYADPTAITTFTSSIFFKGANPWADVKAFGAVGDGVNDDTTAIQNAINSLAHSGGIVAFPVGTYKTSSTLNLGNGNGSTASTVNGIKLLGLAQNTGLNGISGTPTAGPINISYTGSSAAISINGPINGVGIENITITSTVPATTTTRGIFTSASWFGDFKNILITNIGGIAILEFPLGTANSAFNSWRNIQVYIPSVSATAQGIHLTSNSSTVDNFSELWDNVNIIPNVSGHQAVVLSNCDTIEFNRLTINPAGCQAVLFDYTASSGNVWPSGCTFINTEFGHLNNVSNNGTPGSGARPNYLIAHSEVNGVQNPDIQNLIPALPTLVTPSVSLSGQSASIGSTTITTTYITGMYRLSYYLENTITGNNVNISVTFGWQDDTGNTVSLASATIQGNLGSYTNGMIPIRSVSGTTITYLTTVSASLGAGRYALYVKLEKMN